MQECAWPGGLVVGCGCCFLATEWEELIEGHIG